MGELGDALAGLAAVPHAPAVHRSRAGHPAGWEPGVVWDGDKGTVTSAPMTARPTNWDDLLRTWDLDPARYEVVEPVQFRAWDAAIGGGKTQRMYYYRCQVITRRSGALDVERLMDEIARHRPPKRPAPTGDLAWSLNVADPQIGKPDGDGTRGTVGRWLDALDASVARLKELRRLGRPLGPVYLGGLGDIIEGCGNSHYAMQDFGLELSMTEQLRVARRLVLKTITTLAPLTQRLVVVAVPGNHGEVRRNGKAYTSFSDNYDTESFVQAAEVLEANPDAYGHVSLVVPQRDDLTVTLDVAGTLTAYAHGHQARGGGGVVGWWKSQAHGMTPPGDATLLLTGHYHHLRVEQAGRKTWIQAPSLDGGSQWFTLTSGQSAPPGMLSLVIGDGAWGDLAVL